MAMYSETMTTTTTATGEELSQRCGWFVEQQRIATKLAVLPKIECGKRKRESSKKDTTEVTKKLKTECKEEDSSDSEECNPVLEAEELKQRLLYLHRFLSPSDADPYQGDIESMVCLFVDKFWPDLAPMQWDLNCEEDTPASEVEMNSYALCLCTSLFCGALVKEDGEFAKEMLMLCASLVNVLPVQLGVPGTSEQLQKNFGVSLLFLARGLVDCSYFQNDLDAIVLAKRYCAMASEIFP